MFLPIFAVHCFATLPRTERGRPIVVGRDPKGKNFLYVNDNSVVIRDIEVSMTFLWCSCTYSFIVYLSELKFLDAPFYSGAVKPALLLQVSSNQSLAWVSKYINPGPQTINHGAKHF